MSASPSTAQPAESALISYGNFLFRYRNAVFPCVTLPLLIGFRPTWYDNANIDLTLNIVGITAILLGSILRCSVIGFKYVKRGGKDKKVFAETLVIEGFFNHCRNPLYVGNLLVVAGMILIHGNPWVLAIGSAFFGLTYIAIVAAEENYLRHKFGEQYDAYCRRVSRWWINPVGLRASLKGIPFAWGRVIIKEYGSTALALWSIVFLLAYEQWRNQDAYQPSAAIKYTLIILGILIAIAYVTARTLKKTRIIQDTPDAPVDATAAGV
jgi:protein-S-isoprenylcysteine O-methyltransferase Ste14